MIRTMEITDLPRVAEIHVFGWRSAYRGIISDEYLFNKMLVSRRMSSFESAVKNNTEESYVYDDGMIKAFMTIGDCRDEDKPGAFELWGIYVEPFMKRQGIGSILMDYCERIAIERGFSEICLWVLEDNTEGRSFYEKLGYVPDGAKKRIDFLSVTEMRYTKKLSGFFEDVV